MVEARARLSVILKSSIELLSVYISKFYFKGLCKSSSLNLRLEVNKTKARQKSSLRTKGPARLGLDYFRLDPLLVGMFKLRCDGRFTHAFTACVCVFKEITLVGSNQGNYFENATACSKRTLKTTVATQLYSVLDWTSRICTHLAFNGEMKNKFGAIQRKTK